MLSAGAPPGDCCGHGGCPACVPSSAAGLDDMSLAKRRRILHGGDAQLAAPCEPACSADRTSEHLRPASPAKEEECPPAPPSPRAASCSGSAEAVDEEAAARRQRAEHRRRQAGERAARKAAEAARNAAGMAVMGRRLEVYCAAEGGWYRGRVAQFSAKTGRHTVRCDNGAIEALRLEADRHRWVDAAAPFAPMLIAEEADELA